jgi:hypothetical protein
MNSSLSGRATASDRRGGRFPTARLPDPSDIGTRATTAERATSVDDGFLETQARSRPATCPSLCTAPSPSAGHEVRGPSRMSNRPG